MTRSSLQCVLIVAAITLANVIVYAPVRHHKFIVYDDDLYVAKNPRVLEGISPSGITWSFTTFRGGNYHPLTWLSHMFDSQIVGDRPGGHHIANAVVHLASSILLYFVLLRLTAASAPSALVALLFAVHPLHVESVAWVSERKDTLSTLLGFGALLAYAAYVRQPKPARYVAVCLLFAASLLAKPMLVTLPFVLLLLDYWPLNRLTLAAVREKVVLLGLTIIACIVAMSAQSHAGATGGEFTLPARLANATVSYVEYLRKTVAPTDLALGYPHPVILNEPIPPLRIAVCAAILLAITSLALWQRRRRPWLLVGWLWYLGTLVPVIGIVQVGSQGLADRYTYIPLIGIFIMVAWTLWDLLGNTTLAATARAAVATALVLACVLLARRQVSYWNDTYTLFEHTLDVSPKSYIAHDCLGVAYSQAGNVEPAMQHFRESLALFPTNAQSHNNLGVLLYQQHQFWPAIEHYSIAIKGQPQFVDAHNNLGNALQAVGRGDLAIEQYQAALELDPDLAQAHNNLGLLLAERGRIDEALVHFRHAVRSDPNYANAHYALALALEAKGNLAEAEAHDRKALDLNPDFIDARKHLARIQARSHPTTAATRPAPG